ncbi:hypothetical protein [Clostridium cellulovorans]|uniref:Ribonuclease E n=1 Tax=Clostridium cellulovorans (strain ATCC 35296 / DSM 3052 / OCM 3 / 743B) TaxID=573061 RepID=D9SRP8_CLOC7|nr:hypothetical protein [Clostridium cellulovorans]ADL50415.1 ribonuclease E [Clostridium cellulovorans 743B]
MKNKENKRNRNEDCKRNNNNLEVAEEIAIDRDCRDNREEKCRKKNRER